MKNFSRLEEYKILAIRILLAYVFYSIARVLFYVYNSSLIKVDGVIDFLKLAPGKYFIRVVWDANGNKIFDTGNYLNKIQPERVSFFKEIEIRADWGISEVLEFKEE